jgi:hypothetical protein
VYTADATAHHDECNADCAATDEPGSWRMLLFQTVVGIYSVLMVEVLAQ